jgi:hypothetical protein
MTAEENLRLIREIEANRDFLLAAYRQNPRLLELAEPRIRQLFSPAPEAEKQERKNRC